MALSWIAADLKTGQVICDLPSLQSSDPFRRTIGNYETSTATLTVNVDTIDPAWEQAVKEGGSAVIAYTGQPGEEVIVWGGCVIGSPRDQTNQVQLSLVTPEGLLDRCYAGDYTATNRGQNLVVQDLVNQFVVPRGFPFIVEILDGAGAALSSYQTNDYDDKTVYSCLEDLMAAAGGPEWTADWVWDQTVTPATITPRLTVGTRLGTGVPAGMAYPPVTFDETKMLSYLVPHSYATGAGANVVTATGTGQGLARDSATMQSANFDGRPHYEYRYAPSTSIFDTLSLGDHATKTLSVMQGGNQSVTFTVEATATGYQLNVDWFLGDDLGYSIQGPTMPKRVDGIARCVGYEASQDGSVTPLLFVPAVNQ